MLSPLAAAEPPVVGIGRHQDPEGAGGVVSKMPVVLLGAPSSASTGPISSCRVGRGLSSEELSVSSPGAALRGPRP